VTPASSLIHQRRAEAYSQPYTHCP